MIETVPSARLEAYFESADGKTRMGRCFASAPLKIAKTFPLDEGLSVCIMDCSPGLLAGDHYRLHWHLGENARVSVSTQGFTRVHPSHEAPCHLEQGIQLERGAWLEWFPEPTMLFREAALRNVCEAEIAEDATLLLGEIVCAGRVGRGEAFEFHQFQSRLRVRRAGRLLFFSQTGLRPAKLDPRRIAAWRDYTHQGQFYVFSPRSNETLLINLRALLDGQNEVWGGASLLDEGGLAVSLLGYRAHDLQTLTLQLREATRQFLRDFET